MIKVGILFAVIFFHFYKKGGLMKYFLNGLLFLLLILTLIFANCATNSDSNSGGGDKSGSSKKINTQTPIDVTEVDDESSDTTETTETPETPVVDTTPTGTVIGTVNDDAIVTITQSDGTTQTTTTSADDPDIIFENVPIGEATVTITTDQGQTTTQTIQVNEGETTQINPFGSTQEMDNSLLAKVFEVPDNGNSVNEITDNQLGNDFYSKEINVPERSFSEGFPGITDRYEWFGIIYSGQITAPITGKYTFKITCDDGAVLWIDGEEVVNGDGVHPTKTYQGKILLEAGKTYNFLLKYFQGPRYHITLVLENKIPGEKTKLFNIDDYKK